MSKKGEIDLELKAEELGLELDNLATSVEQEFNADIANIAHAAHAKIVAEAQEKLNSTRGDYLKGLSFNKIGENSYLIHLEGKFSEALEKGWAPYDQRKVLLQSKKIVEVGSRAGQPWVQRTAEGSRFAHVPMQRKPFSKAPKAQNMADLIRQVKVRNRSGKEQRITSIFKDPSGKALQGKVARVDPKAHPELSGLVKYQNLYKDDAGKQHVESIYIQYRTISDNGEGWVHPGFKGLDAFSKAEAWVESEIENILRHYLS